MEMHMVVDACVAEVDVQVRYYDEVKRDDIVGWAGERRYASCSFASKRGMIDDGPITASSAAANCHVRMDWISGDTPNFDGTHLKQLLISAAPRASSILAHCSSFTSPTIRVLGKDASLSRPLPSFVCRVCPRVCLVIPSRDRSSY